MEILLHKAIVIYDGQCGFCSFWVNFIHKNDSKNVFLFATNQSDFAQSFLSQNIDSIIVIQHGKAVYQWKALIVILKQLRSPYFLLAFVLKFIPSAIGNRIYNIVAKNRHRLSRSCIIPENSLRAKIYPWLNSD
jgi:predicted DCC family thiol-disulfide oxidoreductase YuxK